MGKAKPKSAPKKTVAKKVATKKPAAKKPAPKSKTAPKAAKAAPKGKTAPVEAGWMDAGKGYAIAIRDGKLVAQKDGKALGSVPKPVKESPLGDRLESAIDFLDDHEIQCRTTVESWMLRTLPVPRSVLAAVVADEAWRTVLHDAWIVPVDNDGKADRAAGGFFRSADAKKGIGTVGRDGETVWIDAQSVLVPHPILLDELDDLRGLATEIGVSQGLSQLLRETFQFATAGEDPNTVTQFSGGEFAVMNTAIQLAKRLGYRVSGGSAVCRVLERGKLVEARYDLGDGEPMYETTTGDLTWVDDKQRTLAVADVPPVAYSEGMRMASLIYAKRKVEEKSEEEES
ncbi:MAG: DUF4132 domain-containing protein [Kofleriaceae bacterium]